MAKLEIQDLDLVHNSRGGMRWPRCLALLGQVLLKGSYAFVSGEMRGKEMQNEFSRR